MGTCYTLACNEVVQSPVCPLCIGVYVFTERILGIDMHVLLAYR